MMEYQQTYHQVYIPANDDDSYCYLCYIINYVLCCVVCDMLYERTVYVYHFTHQTFLIHLVRYTESFNSRREESDLFKIFKIPLFILIRIKLTE